MKKFHVKMFGLAACILVSIGAGAQFNVGGSVATSSTLAVTGSESHTTTALTVSTTLDATHYIVIVPNGITVTLPANSSSITGRTYIIRMGYNASGAIVSIPSGSSLVVKNTVYNSGTPLNLTRGESITIMSDGTNWYATNNDIKGGNIVTAASAPVSTGSLLYPTYIDQNGDKVTGINDLVSPPDGTIINYVFSNIANTANTATKFESGTGDAAWEITVKSYSSNNTGGQQFNTGVAKFSLIQQKGTTNGINSVRFLYGNSNMGSNQSNVNQNLPITTTDLALPVGFVSGRNLQVNFPTLPASSITLAVGVDAAADFSFVVTSSATGALYVEMKKIY